MKEHKKRTNKLWMRIGLVALCLVLAFGTTVTIMASGFNGDLDGDGKITAYDAQILAEYQAGKRDLDPATVIGLTVRGILDRVLGKIVDEPTLADGIEKTFKVKAEDGIVTKTETFEFGMVTVTVPEGAKITGTELTVTVKQKSFSEGGITLEEGQELLPLDIHVEGVAADNTAPIIIRVAEALETGMNLGNVTLYHVENGEPVAMTQVMSAEELTAHNTFYYDPATGDVSVAMATFSVVTMVSDTQKVWKGNYDYSWYENVIPKRSGKANYEIFNADQLAAFGAIVDGTAKDENGNAIAQDSFLGETVTLCMDVTLSDGNCTDGSQTFDPIGYGYVYGDGQAFMGTFDGNGNTIKNLYQNGWSLGLSYSTAGGGLFASACDATIKNLTMDGAYIVMECIDMGTVVGYAQGNCTFENIIVRNSTLANYQRYTGGAIGEVSNGHHTLKNVDVEASTTVGSLWGDFDNASGGLIGGKWGHNYDNRTGENGHKVSVYMENCDSAATLDVYNDVTSAYQWYSYRRCGMLIGMSEESTSVNGRTEATASYLETKNCTVQYGDWVNYHYCEFTGTTSLDARYPWVRVEGGEFCGAYSNPRYGVPAFDGAELKVENHITENDCHVEGDGHNVEIIFNQLYGGGQGCYGGNSHVGNGVTVISKTGEVKPTTKFEFQNVNIAANSTVKLGDLFEAVTGADIKSAYVYAFVSPANEASAVRGTIVIPEANTDWTQREITFTGEGEAKIVITDYYYCLETVVIVTVGAEQQPVEKFATKFTGDFLYRVGNDDTTHVKLDSLFTGTNVTEGNVTVTVETMAGTATGEYTPNETNWTQGTINFNNTGVVKVTITDNDYCIAEELILEVVDAKNATSATSATANNVVLLNDTSATSLSISGGNTFYGNGFEIAFDGDGSYKSAAVSYGFVTITDGGILENTQIKCKIFPKAYLFTNEMTAGSDGRYPYGYSAVVISDNSTISNCYIYGARNNVQVGDGQVTIKDTVLECGSVANIHIKSAAGNTVTLHNVTTIQYCKQDDFGEGNTMMGFGVLVGDNESSTYPTIKITGEFNQHNWVTAADAKKVSGTYVKQAINGALDVSEYVHTNVNEVNTVNMGIAFLTTNTVDIDDQRDGASNIYGTKEISMSGYTGQVYSILAKSGTTPEASNQQTDAYTADYQETLPTIQYEGVNDTVTLETGYNKDSKKFENVLNVDLDNITGGSYVFSFSDLDVWKYGADLEFTVKDSAGNPVDLETPITLNQLFTGEYTLFVTDNMIVGTDGQISGESKTVELPFTLRASKTSIEPPKFTNAGTATAIRLVSKKGGDWRPAYTVLTGVTVTYWSASEGKVKTVDLSTLYNLGTISSNVWTYTCDDYTLTITGGQVHSDGSKITPVVANNTLYFASTNKAFTTGTTSRNIILTYVFTDKNDSTTWNRTETVTYSALSEYSYDSFKDDGELEEPSSSSGIGCFAEGTMITLADGTQKPIEEITYTDEVLAWDFHTGTYVTTVPSMIDVYEATEQRVINLRFADGTTARVVVDHGFFSVRENNFVFLSEKNVDDYVGDEFVKVGKNGTYATTKLIGYDVTVETVAYYSFQTAIYNNCIAQGMFTLPSPPEMLENDGWFDYFEIGDNMKYDEAKMQADIEKYGLYTYEDFAEYVTYEQFIAFNGPYLKVLVGRGVLTYEEIFELIAEYVAPLG